MVRKHFETHAKNEINRGKLIKSGAHYYVRYMNHSDLDLNLALQDNVLKTLRLLGKTHYIIAKDKAYLGKLLNRGNAIIGTFVPDDDPKKPDRLAAHMLVVYPQNQSETGLSDPSVLPDKDLGKISVVSNILVHQDFRGNRLMQQMLDEWLKLATDDGKSHAIAEICIDNPFSWGVFLDCGFVIYAEGHDARDGSDLVYVHKPLDCEFVYSSDPKDVTMIRLFDEHDAVDPKAHRQLKDLLAQGYHVIDFDRGSKLMLLAKCVGTMPLNELKQTPAKPINDNKPR